MEIVKYILNLIKSKNARPLYRTKLMVVGYMNVGKTTLIDNLFSLSASVEKKRWMLPGYYPCKITLLGKKLTEMDGSNKINYILDEKCKVETQSNDHIFS